MSGGGTRSGRRRTGGGARRTESATASSLQTKTNESEIKVADISSIEGVTPDKSYKETVINNLNDTYAEINKLLGENISEKDIQYIESEMQRITNSEDTHIGIRLNKKALGGILSSGRFKSQIETQKRSNGSVLAVDQRKLVEEKQMGYSSYDFPVKQRPIYGMLFNYKKVSEVDATWGNGYGYGNIIAIMKPSVKKHSTVTVGDSFNKYRGVVPSSMLKPSRYSMYIPNPNGSEWSIPETTNFFKDVKARKKFSMSEIIDFGYSGYMEAQIHHGQARVSNIQHLIFGKGTLPSPSQERKLKSLGITWSEEGSDKFW